MSAPALPPRSAAMQASVASTTDNSADAFPATTNTQDAAPKYEAVHEGNATSDDKQLNDLADDASPEQIAAAMPVESHPTISFLIPFPKAIGLDVKTQEKELPFLLYSLPPPRLEKPKEGEKETKVHKALRKWQEEEDGAKGQKGVKAKAIGRECRLCVSDRLLSDSVGASQ